MSSTEQKNITQTFITCCHTFGILPTILTRAFDNYGLESESPPFEGLGPTPHLGERIRKAVDPISDVSRLLPSVRNAGSVTRGSVIILKLCSDSRVLCGNQGILRFAESLILRRWGCHVTETPAFKHAARNVSPISGMLAPASYGSSQRAISNIKRYSYSGDSAYIRRCSESVDYILRHTYDTKYLRKLRGWCNQYRSQTGFSSRYNKNKAAIDAYEKFDPECLCQMEDPPDLQQKWIYTNKKSGTGLKYYRYNGLHFFKVINKMGSEIPNRIISAQGKASKEYRYSTRSRPHELYVFSRRDLEDLKFLLQSAAHIRLYLSKRLSSVPSTQRKMDVKRTHMYLWSDYLQVMGACGRKWKLRNKLGVYFDVLQWRYLAWKSGDEFYNHSDIMAAKIKSKGLEELPSQSPMLEMLKQLNMDAAIDMLGVYKASIYPEVDPFKVVCDQYRLHMSRFNTDWEPGSLEHERFAQTKAYMWYFGIRVLYQKRGLWPGRIRNGASPKSWHKTYKKDGIPPGKWDEAHDVDLRGSVPVSDISNEQYMRQQDAACAPPLWQEYTSFEALRKCPRRHRRKILYAIQETDMPDLSETLSRLNEIGRELPDGYIDKIDCDLGFSTDIVTGSRCERHKDAPRPFYAASPPWGCILSYFDGIIRDFLNNVPQSMLGKSTRQKFLDLSTSARSFTPGSQSFFMSDDKAKYSPRMDPQSQQLPADFFAELFDIPGIKACGPIMYHNNLFYRVCGHLVHYGSNGTDREGMRGASNTWLEIVAQGLTTRLSREKGLIKGKSIFLSFIDDGLRKFSVDIAGRDKQQVWLAARKVIDDVIFGLKVLGRELSWDKTFISRDLFVILNEILYDGSHYSSGLKSFCTTGDIEMKEVMTAPDYEQLYFGKMRGAHGVGSPLDLCHYVYLFETLMAHHKMGLNLQNFKMTTNLDYRLFCITPVSMGGGGFRSLMQLGCNEVASATKEGLGNLLRLGNDQPFFMPLVESIVAHPLETLSPVDFMREPEQFHVSGPRLKTQRLTAEVRKRLGQVACNRLSRSYLEQDRIGLLMLANLGKTLMATGDVSAEEVRLLYATTPVAFIDDFIQKLASSTTLSEVIGKEGIGNLRRMAKKDLIISVGYFRFRTQSDQLVGIHRGDMNSLLLYNIYMQ